MPELARRLARKVPAPKSWHARLRAYEKRTPPPLGLDSALFLDIDGTLLDLAETPTEVLVDNEIVALLPALREALGGALALVTGRSIRDSDRLFPTLKLALAGQHGCERRDAQGMLHLHAADRPTLDRLGGLFRQFAARNPGVWLETKGSTLALHYRSVPHLERKLYKGLEAAVAASGATGFRLQPGKCLLEIRPDSRDKGTAIRDFMKESPFAGRRPVFIGDDKGDEHGFERVRLMKGWAVKVGEGPTAAQYRLHSVKDVRAWLAAAIEASR